MPVTCFTIMKVMEDWAPASLAESWDNVGLMVGHPEQVVSKVMVALDATQDTLLAALEQGCQMVVTHHPFLFGAMKSLRGDRGQGERVNLAIRGGLAVFSAHTNLDAAVDGVNDVLAARLGVTATEPLQISGREKYLKLTVYVPRTHTEQVALALGDAGCGHIGNYSHCSFRSAGQGTFLPLTGTQPFIGQIGTLEQVEEDCLSTLVPKRLLPVALQTLLTVHPYEEVAYDLFPLENEGAAYGLGRIGDLAAGSLSVEDFLDQLCSSLELTQVRMGGNTALTEVKRIALCGGSGAGLLSQAIRGGAQVFITGDVKYHDMQQAADGGILLVDAGHFATEHPVVEKIAERLRTFATDGKQTLEVVVYQKEKDSISYYPKG